MLGEFRNKNIFTENGLAGICLLVLTLADEIKQHLKADVFFASAIKRMQNSLIWELSANNRVFTDNIGLFGYCGAVLILNALSDTISEIKKE